MKAVQVIRLGRILLPMKKGKYKQQAKMGLQMVKKYKISTIKTEKHINAYKSTSKINFCF